MTFCLGMRVRTGLVGIADTRITSGYQAITAKKVSLFQGEKSAMFLMTSGLRSVRDKALTYFEERMEAREEPFDRLYKAVNSFADQIRRVAEEDQPSLKKSGMNFDIHCLIGGQMAHDHEPKLYLLYPQGNWVEVAQGTPYQIVGASGYGKPILDRTFTFEDPLSFALKVGILAFDSTRISATDVDWPVDVVLYEKDSFRMVEHRYFKEDLQQISDWWMERLRHSILDLPSEWIERVQAQLTPTEESLKCDLEKERSG
jgi:putative proteasome-type protease